MLECNPCQIEQVTNPKPERVAFVPTIAKLEAIADKQSGSPKTARFRAMVLLSAWCGLRYGEVRAGRLTQPERPTVNHRDDKPRRHLAKERLQPRERGVQERQESAGSGAPLHSRRQAI